MKKSIFISLFSLIVLAYGCKDDDDPAPAAPPNEEEVITTVILTFTEKGGTATSTFTYRDEDGDGGNPPSTWEPIALDTGKVYELSIELLNESDPNDVDTVTNEIIEEDDEHLFCFTPSTPVGPDVTITRTDSDGTYEVGLMSDWDCGAASAGTVLIVLKHQPDGEKDGTCGPGDTDIELDWPTTIN